MRITQVFNRYLQRGGEEISVERISDALSKRHSIYHCYFDSRQMAGTETISEKLNSAGQILWNFQAAERLRDHLDVVQPDFVLFHNFLPYGSASVLHEVQRRGVKTLYYIHNFRPFSVNGYLWSNGKLTLSGLKKNFWPEIVTGSWQQSRLRTFIASMAISFMHRAGFYRKIDRWLAISDFMRATFIQAGIPEDKIVTIRHSAVIDPLNEDIHDAGYYLFIGRLISAKGIQPLLKTWDLLTARLGSATPVLKIAGEGELAPEIESFAFKNSNVHFLGRIDGENKMNQIRNCRAMIAPSLWWEPLGIVTYEAYNFCKPMLAARSGGLTETVEHNRTGLLHHPGDANQLADQILMLESEPMKAKSLGQNGREWLCNHCSEDEWLSKFDNILSGFKT